MKKFIKTVCLLFAAAFMLTNCEDVPAPYQAPGENENESNDYINESFSNDLGDFVSQSTSGTLEWIIDYQAACVTGYQDFDGDGTKENQAGVTFLISPAIDLSGSTGAYITFDHAINYERGDIAANNSLVISKDYAGDAATATWEQLPINTEGTNSDFTFVNAGKISIPAEYIGVNPVYVALRHTCTDAASSTWEVRNFRVVEGEGDEISSGEDEVNTIFSEPFNSSLGAFTINNVKPAEGLGKEVWTYDSQYLCAKATSYTGGEGGSNIPTESWLVSPVIDLKEVSAATLVFDHAANYFNDVKTDVTVWITDAANENWEQLNVPTYPTSFTFVGSGDIDLNAYKGKEVKVAFKYVCTTKAGTYEVKNFRVLERQAEEAPEVPDTDESISVAEAIAQYDESQAQPNVRVKGYIVGFVNGMDIETDAIFGAEPPAGVEKYNTNLLIADDVNETDYTQCLVIQLPSGNVRDALNLQDNPGNLGKEVILLGSLETYFGTYGLKSVTEYTLDGETPEEPEEPGGESTFTKAYEIVSGAQYTMVAIDGDEARIAQNLPESYNYGRLSSSSVEITNDMLSAEETATYTITAVEGGYTIQDSYGRYMYMEGSFNTFNVSADLPSSDYVWSIDLDSNGQATITNIGKGKWIQYSTQYRNFECLSADSGLRPYLFKKN